MWMELWLWIFTSHCMNMGSEGRLPEDTERGGGLLGAGAGLRPI